MKTIFGLGAMVFVGVVGWRVGGSLSTDALGMAIGILFGVMAGIPTALLMLASQRNTEKDDGAYRLKEPPRRALPPPVQNVYINHNHYGPGGPVADVSRQISGPVIDDPRPRSFRIVEEVEDLDW